jgi:hypothetical protein
LLRADFLADEAAFAAHIEENLGQKANKVWRKMSRNKVEG